MFSLAFAGLDDSDDDTEESEGTAENLYDKDFNEG
jgi:hypothetical protein